MNVKSDLRVLEVFNALVEKGVYPITCYEVPSFVRFRFPNGEAMEIQFYLSEEGEHAIKIISQDDRNDLCYEKTEWGLFVGLKSGGTFAPEYERPFYE